MATDFVNPTWIELRKVSKQRTDLQKCEQAMPCHPIYKLRYGNNHTREWVVAAGKGWILLVLELRPGLGGD